MFDTKTNINRKNIYGSQHRYEFDFDEDQQLFLDRNGIELQSLELAPSAMGFDKRLTILVYSRLLHKEFKVETKNALGHVFTDLQIRMNDEIQNELTNKLILGQVDILSRGKDGFKVAGVRKVDEQTIIKCGSDFNECLVGIYKECTLKQFTFGIDMPEVTGWKLEDGRYKAEADYVINGVKISAMGASMEACFKQLAFAIAKDKGIELNVPEALPSVEPTKEEGFEDIEELDSLITNSLRSLCASQYIDARLLNMAMTKFEEAIMCLEKALKVGNESNDTDKFKNKGD